MVGWSDEIRLELAWAKCTNQTVDETTKVIFGPWLLKNMKYGTRTAPSGMITVGLGLTIGLVSHTVAIVSQFTHALEVYSLSLLFSVGL